MLIEIPDSETFSDCSVASDCGIIHLYTLSLLKRFDPNETCEVARYCFNIVDSAVGEALLLTGFMTPEMEIAIGDHPLVQAELRWQEFGREILDATLEGDIKSMGAFLDRWALEPVRRTM